MRFVSSPYQQTSQTDLTATTTCHPSAASLMSVHLVWTSYDSLGTQKFGLKKKTNSVAVNHDKDYRGRIPRSHSSMESCIKSCRLSCLGSQGEHLRKGRPTKCHLCCFLRCFLGPETLLLSRGFLKKCIQQQLRAVPITTN